MDDFERSVTDDLENTLSQSDLQIKDKILVVGTGPQADFVQQVLSENNWVFDRCESDEEFNELIEKNNYPVVVAIFDDDESLLRSIEHQALANFTTKWLAIVPDEEWLHRHLNMRFSQLFYDYHRMPIQENRFLDTLGHAYGMAKLSFTELENTSRHQILVSDSSIDEIVGRSDAMRELRRMVKVIAEENLTVLIMGESGTGKELIARNIHFQSERHQHPFIAINCASLPESLIHSELFGHEKGAFTGADKRAIGKIEAADLGTLFLDEIGDMPMNIQVSLLRFLETRRIQRLGGISEIDVDCRIILATNVDLKQAVEEGKFREDLYHRINVIPVQVPTLREHRSDIPDLAEEFLSRFNRGKSRKFFSNECLRVMQVYDWPGNVRELMNRIRRAIVVSSDKAITAEKMGLDEVLDNNVIDLNTARHEAEKKAIMDALNSCGNNHTLAAESLGISRTSLYRLMGKFEEEKKKF